MNHELNIENCWAKTDEAGNPVLSVLDHCLHVGKVGRSVVRFLPPPLQALVPSSGILLIAAHDIGKISPGFLLKCPTWRNQWQAPLKLGMPQTYETKHAKSSQAFLAAKFARPPQQLIAVGGHHGTYLCNRAKLAFPPNIGGREFDALREELLASLEQTFGKLSPDSDLEKGAPLHWFTGLMIFSDWIGSNPTWFSSATPRESLADAASKALETIGWHRHAVHSQASFAELFGLESPRPLQQALTDAVDSPGLYIVEAPMGDGKTEAALMAAYRRWSEGSERGLYFALPTQLTSNRIHQRVETFLSHAVADWSKIALVHGNAWLRENRIQPLAPTDLGENSDEPDPSTDGNRWFSDNRRALLAPFGIGTVDQALMAVLPVRFSALRLFALGGKVVVIDEVHSYDAYTSAIIDRTVEWLLQLHCTVIILSATLTMARRRALLEAAGAKNVLQSNAYPIITKVATGSGEAQSIDIEGPSATSKVVGIECLSAAEEKWLQRGVNAAETGACVLVIRNTVALAQQTFDQLKAKSRDTGVQFGLIHSRFTQADRLKNETHWMELLGKSQENRPLRGAILVGTQVLEQSVDIDADLLITDLAPTDLILQRMGRLHRHSRPRPVGFAEPRCLVLSPEVDWEQDAKTIKEQLKPHRFIYPPFSLFMAHRIWSRRKSISLPAEIRAVLEESASIPKDLPRGMETLHQEFLAEIEKQIQTALRLGPFTESPLEDTEGTDTRWNMQPPGHLIVLRNHPRSAAAGISVVFPDDSEMLCEPGRFNFALARQLHCHAISVPRYLVRNLQRSTPDWLQLHFPGAALAVRDELDTLVPCHGQENCAYHFSYSQAYGLTFEKRHEVFTEPEDDESWF